MSTINAGIILQDSAKIRHFIIEAVQDAVKELIPEPKADLLSDDLLNQKQVAEQFSVSRQTIRNWEIKGWITPIRLGRRVFFSKAEIINSLKQNKG